MMCGCFQGVPVKRGNRADAPPGVDTWWIHGGYMVDTWWIHGGYMVDG